MELIILTKEQLQEITNGITTRLDNLECKSSAKSGHLRPKI